MKKEDKKKKTKGKSVAKKITGWLHLWLGLISGLIVFVVALSGTLFVFCDETIDLLAGDAKYVSALHPAQKLSPEELLHIFHRKLPQRKAFYFDAYKNADRTFRVASATKPPADAPKGKRIRGVFAYTYMNPYTGEILKTSKSYEFFYVVAHIHSQLLMRKTGRTIVGIATIIFLVQLIGGLVLWWPKKWSKATKTAAFKIKANTKWRRRNYDLHNVLGFYALLPAILLTVTGLIMAYEILGTLTQKTFGGNPDAHELSELYEPEYNAQKKAVSFSDIIGYNFAQYPKARQLRMSFSDRDSVTTYYTTIGESIGLKSQINGAVFLTDKYTGKQVQFPPDFEQHEIIEQTNFDLHVGYWAGLFGKIFTFIIGLICTSLPVTGFLIWWGRRKKVRRNTAMQS